MAIDSIITTSKCFFIYISACIYFFVSPRAGWFNCCFQSINFKVLFLFKFPRAVGLNENGHGLPTTTQHESAGGE